MENQCPCIYCCWLKYCDESTKQKCADNNYIIFANIDDKNLCNLMCGEAQDD